MKKWTFLAVVIMAMCTLVGCAQPDNVKSTNLDNADKVNKAESVAIDTQGAGASVGENMDASDTTDVKDDNGREINDTYGTGEYTFNIKAKVSVPDAAPQSGTLSGKTWDKALIEQYLCDGETLIEQTGSSGQEYVSTKNEAGTDLAYDMCFSMGGNGSASFTNWRLDSYFSGATHKLIPSEERNNEQQQFAEAMMNKAQDIVDNLGLEAQVSHCWMEERDKNNTCTVFINSCVDDYQLVSKDYGTFIQSNMSVAEPGVNVFNIGGNYQTVDAQAVSVLTLDQILGIVKQGVEDKNINGLQETIERVELAYMVEDNGTGAVFYPVWCFSGALDSDSGMMPLLCLDAQTGEIKLMAG